MEDKSNDTTSNLLDVFTKSLDTTTRRRSRRKVRGKKDEESLLPVAKIDDNDKEPWSKERFQIEVAKSVVGDKTTKIIKEVKPKFVESSDVSREDAIRWIPKGIRAFKGKPVNYRKSGREGKVFELDPDYFPMVSNTLEINLSAEDENKVVTAKEKTDVAQQIYDNILQYGRRTIDEIEKDLGAYQRQMLVLITNGMIHDHFLKIVKEIEIDSITGEPILDDKTGKIIVLETIELVDKDEREQRLQKRRLEDVKKRKKMLKESKK